ncbi:MAG: hypothetical protein WDN28_03005 [Chthoniobacter sp.]
MKPLPFLLVAALTLPACVSSPEQKAAEHQRELQEEAKEKFEEQKEKDKERADEVREARERAADDAARYKAYEAEYARQLGKKPSQLTPEERQWVRDHF